MSAQTRAAERLLSMQPSQLRGDSVCPTAHSVSLLVPSCDVRSSVLALTSQRDVTRRSLALNLGPSTRDYHGFDTSPKARPL